MSKPLARALLVLGSLLLPVVLLVLVELVLVGLDLPARDDGPVRFDGLQERSRVVRSDPDLLFRFAPNADFLGYYRTNALGYRGAGAPRPREEVVRRIVTIGDSCTFGLGVPEEAVYSSRLEQTLRRAFEGEGDFEVVSLGIPGYSSWQNRRQIESGLEGLAPDAILWMPTGYNDAVASGGANDLERGAEARSWGGWFARRRLVRLVAGPATVDLERERAGLAVLHEGASPRVPVARFREQLEAGATAARAAGASLLLVRPALDEALLALDPSLARRESEVAEVATALGLPLVDARRAFAPFEGVPVTSDRLHPNGDGHALLAEAAFRTLVRSDVLPDGPRLRFLRALVSAAEEGLDPDDPAWTDPAGRPPAFSESGGDGRRDPAAEAWLAALDAERRGAPSDALRARAALLDERLVPAGLLRTLLWGERPPRAIADETLALARRLAAFGARLGLRPLRVDVADAAARSAAAAGDAERADERFRAALALDPANTDARYAYVRWLQKVGRQEEADIETNRLLEIDPDSARARELAGLRALVAGRTDEALAHLERARTLDPVAPWTLYALGRAYLERQRFAEAEVALRTARMLAAASFPDVDELHARAVAALGR